VPQPLVVDDPDEDVAGHLLPRDAADHRLLPVLGEARGLELRAKVLHGVEGVAVAAVGVVGLGLGLGFGVWGLGWGVGVWEGGSRGWLGVCCGGELSMRSSDKPTWHNPTTPFDRPLPHTRAHKHTHNQPRTTHRWNGDASTNSPRSAPAFAPIDSTNIPMVMRDGKAWGLMMRSGRMPVLLGLGLGWGAV